MDLWMKRCWLPFQYFVGSHNCWPYICTRQRYKVQLNRSSILLLLILPGDWLAKEMRWNEIRMGIGSSPSTCDRIKLNYHNWRSRWSFPGLVVPRPHYPLWQCGDERTGYLLRQNITTRRTTNWLANWMGRGRTRNLLLLFFRRGHWMATIEQQFWSCKKEGRRTGRDS